MRALLRRIVHWFTMSREQRIRESLGIVHGHVTLVREHTPCD
jgi:hypothetical protein